MDLAAATDELYAGSPDEFVARRTALVAAARAAKDRPLATAITKLRRPTRSAWLVNLYARQAPDELAALLDLGAALLAAQEQLSGPELRRLSGQRQKTLAAATRSAAALGAAEGYSATEAVRQEVHQTLQAALADPEVADQVRAGVVTEAHAYGGFGPVSGFPTGAATSTESGPSDAADQVGAGAEQAAEAHAGQDDTEQRRAEAERRLQDAEAALSAAGEHAEATTARADGLADQIDTLRRQLAETEAAEAEARQQARAARREVATAEAEVQAAREAYESI